MLSDRTSQQHVERARRLDQVCNQFERAWQAGRPRIGDCLDGWDGAERLALVRELVLLDAEYRRRGGETCVPADYLASLPELDPDWLAEALVGGSSRHSRVDRETPTAGHVPAPVQPLDGTLFGEHELLGELGRGGMGIVYRAWHRQLGRMVALKMVRAGQVASDDELQRFRAEAELAATLDHPNIVPLYEVGEYAGQPFFSMKLIEGGSLTRHLADTRLDARAVAQLVTTVARAVHHAHQRGVLHRDLKPGNILLDASGAPHVADFGLARHLESDTWMTQSGALVGTPAYMAPEQARGKTSQLTTAADVYALGAILYECLTGKPPFVGETALDTLVLVQTEEPVPPSRVRPGVPRDLEVICLKCLNKEPKARYGSAEALADELQRWLVGEPILARAVTTAERVWRWGRRHPAAAGLLVVSGVALLALVVLIVGLAYNAQLQQSYQNLEEAQEELRTTNGELEQANEAKSQANASLEQALGKLKLEKEETDKQRQRANRLLVVSQILLARQAIQEKKIGHALRLLEALHPRGEKVEDLRGVEWHALWDQCDGYHQVIPAHRDRLQLLTFSPDGRWLASAGADGRVKVWEVQHQHCVADLPVPREPLLALRLDVTGRFLGQLLAGGKIEVWQLTEAEPRPCREVESAGCREVTAKLQSYWKWKYKGERPGSRLARAMACTTLLGLHTSNSLFLGSSVLTELMSHPRFALRNYETMTPDGNLAAYRRELREKDWTHRALVEIHGLWSGKLIQTIDQPGEYVSSVELMPDGSRIALLTSETVHLYPVGEKTARELHTLSLIQAIAFSANGRFFAAGGVDGRVRIWNLERGAGKIQLPIKATGAAGRGTGVAFNGNGQLLAAFGEGIVTVWDTKTGQIKFQDISSPVSWNRGAFHPDGDLLFAGRIFYRLADGQRRVIPDHFGSGNGLGMAFSPDGRLLACAQGQGGIFLHDGRNGSDLQKLPGIKEQLPFSSCVDFSPDGKHLATGSATVDNWKTGAIQLWNTRTWKPMRRLDSHRFSVWRVKYSPNGQLLAAACGDYRNMVKFSEVKIWDVASGRELFTLGGQNDCIFDLCFSPDGRQLASISGKNRNPKAPGELKLWDLTYGQELLTLRDHPGTGTGVAYSPDGKSLASISSDGTVVIRGDLARTWIHAGKK